MPGGHGILCNYLSLRRLAARPPGGEAVRLAASLLHVGAGADADTGVGTGRVLDLGGNVTHVDGEFIPVSRVDADGQADRPALLVEGGPPGLDQR